jgi:hypothetical protein
MAQRNWEKVAEEQFKSMPKSFQADWAELRELVTK